MPSSLSNWDRLSSSPEFRRLIAEKRKFVIPATIFFLVYYFALPILVGYFPDLMKRRVLGPVNIAYIFALSQFVMAWVLAAVYMRVAARFDEMAQTVLGKKEGQSV